MQASRGSNNKFGKHSRMQASGGSANIFKLDIFYIKEQDIVKVRSTYNWIKFKQIIKRPNIFVLK